MTFRDQMAVADVDILAGVGEAVELLNPSDVSQGNVQGAFEHQYVDVLGTESLRPTFTCNTVDLPAAPHGYKIVYNSITYLIITPEPDGTGMTLLVLEAP